MARTHNGPKLIASDSMLSSTEKGSETAAAVLDPPETAAKRKRAAAQPQPTPPQPETGDEEEQDEEIEDKPAPRGNKRKPVIYAGGFNCPIAPFEKEDDFWMRLANFTPDEWKCLIAYLWRTDPKFNAKLGGGRPSHIRKIIQPFDADDIKAWEGSGGYRIDLVGIDPTINGKQSQQRIFQQYFEIMDPNFPPRLPEGAWLDAPENQADWGWCKKALKNKRSSTDDSASSQDVSEIIRAINETNRNAGGSPYDALLPLMLKNLDPANTLELLAKMQPAGGSGGNDTAILQILLKDKDAQMARLEARLDSMATKLETRQTSEPAAGSFLTQLEQQVQIRALMKKLGSGTNTESEGGWVEDLLKGLVPAIPTFLSILQNRQTPGQPQQGQQAQPQAQQQQPQATAPTTAPSQPQTPPQPVSGVTPDHMQFLIKHQAALTRHQALFEAIMPHLQDAFRYEVGADSGNPGRLFASDWFLPRFGIGPYIALKHDFTPKDLVQLVTGTPPIWMGFLSRPIAEYTEAQMKAEIERFSVFMDGFFTADTDEAGQDQKDGEGKQ